ncbi:hypothetical protein [Niallia sp. 03133]|uniref:hypothetical protein n=1 Tax=Niallia sp. 03133 TaxID=3458060 RepID=UPI004043FD4D
MWRRKQIIEQNSHAETLSDKTYNQIKKVIIERELLAGDLLREEEAASMDGIRRTPL